MVLGEVTVVWGRVYLTCTPETLLGAVSITLIAAAPVPILKIWEISAYQTQYQCTGLGFGGLGLKPSSPALSPWRWELAYSR